MFTFNFILTPLTNFIFGVNFQTSQSGCCDQRFLYALLLHLLTCSTTQKKQKTQILSPTGSKKKTLCLTKCFFIFSHPSLFKRATFRSLQIKCEKLYFDEISLINFYFLIFFAFTALQEL